MSALKNNTWDKHVAGLCARARAAFAASKSIIVSFQNSTVPVSHPRLHCAISDGTTLRDRLVHKSSLSFP